MRRRSQNLDDIVINSRKIFQSESCEIRRYLHQIFLPAYHLPEATLIAYHNPLSVLMLVRCYVQRHYDEERKDRQVRVTGKEALFCDWRCGRRTFRIAYAFQKRYPTPTLKPFIFVEEMLLPSYPTSTTIFSSGFICTPAPQANPVFLEEILLEKESPS